MSWSPFEETVGAPSRPRKKSSSPSGQGKIMDMTTLLIIVVIVLLLGGGGFYGRGRWW
jgi:hypothetical protein